MTDLNPRVLNDIEDALASAGVEVITDEQVENMLAHLAQHIQTRPFRGTFAIRGLPDTDIVWMRRAVRKAARRAGRHVMTRARGNTVFVMVLAEYE